MDELKQWALNYFKSRDAFTKSIVSIEDLPDGFLIQRKERKERVSVVPHLTEGPPDAIGADCIVTLNETSNINALVDKWQQFKTRDMKMIFANPSQPHKKWMINPMAHAKVCDESSLKRGLYALAEEAP